MRQKYINFLFFGISLFWLFTKEGIFLNGFMFRLDAPNDKRNSLDWHQDSAYYEMTYPEYNAGV